MADVAPSTNKIQQPVYSAGAPDMPNIVLYPAETAEEAWRAIKNSDNPDMFREFIRQHPDSPFAGAAQAKLDKFDAERRASDAE